MDPRNIESFNQVVANLHLACFWFSSPDMDADGCLERILESLRQNPERDPASLAQLRDAARHLKIALDTPGWTEWMTNGISIPYDCPQLPVDIRKGFSDSRNGCPDLIDAASLLLLKENNKNGKDVESLLSMAEKQHLFKSQLLMTQAESAEKKREEKEKKTKLVVHEEKITAAKEPVKVRSPAKKRIKKETEEERRLREATVNASLAATAHLPRPLPALITVNSRSAKVNFVTSTILSSPEDKFVIFGDIYELSHLTEALELADIESCVFRLAVPCDSVAYRDVISYRRFAGHSVSREKRTEAIKEFEEPQVQVCLLDIKLAARGL